LNTLKLNAFFYHFKNNQREEKRYCFILGSGASKQSGIPTGGELVDIWLKELKEMHGDAEIDKWLKKEKMNSTNLAEYYPQIYAKRFEIDSREGFTFLEKLMANAEPGCGYSVLAQILDTTNNNIVITTNFDSLTEDALFIYTQKKPLVLGHESLASFIKPFGSRPIIAKIHRDLFLAPKNVSDDTDSLDDNWSKNFSNIFKYSTPLSSDTEGVTAV